jgi:hypothetical protein
MLDRRRTLFGMGAGLGAVALNALLQRDAAASREDGPAARGPHHRPRARACIFLFMEGGPSHIDTFDPKPKLDGLHMQEFTRTDALTSAMSAGRRYYVRSPFSFLRAGKSGLPLCSELPHLAGVADELCLYRGAQADSIDHPTACYQLNTGNRAGGDPAIGSWVTYGLGSLNENLPAFVVLPDGAFPQGGAGNWSSGFLPARHQGTPLRSEGPPILDLAPPPEVHRAAQRANLGLLRRLAELDMAGRPQRDELQARLDTYELAYRMQTEVPRVLDLAREPRSTLELYGIGSDATDAFGRRCLLACKLVAAGVRFVQVYAGGWDSHDYLERSHRARMRGVDKPIAALLTDLRRRGLLDETLVVCSGEFGRSPDNGRRNGENVAGRDHNARAMAIWLAGAGVKAGHVVGATDELGRTAIEVVHPLRDLHVTLLHLLGLDDNKLTFLHEGRQKQLSQFGGQVIRDLLV